MNGTAPPGANGEREAAAWVRDMFGRVARRYDLANRLLSFNIDRRWRARAVQRLKSVLDRPDAQVLDICCGTGDLLLALAKEREGLAVESACPTLQPPLAFGSDFCHPMLTAAHAKIERRGARAALFEADALRLPLRDGSLDLIAAAFGFRNLANYTAGLAEMRRVLRPGGMAAILEFSQPPNRAFGALYAFYSRRILPWIGGALSGSRDAYEYLPESVRRFPGPAELAEGMRRAGFREASYELMTGGIVALHVGER